MKGVDMSFFILAVNPGSTSTKLAVYEEEAALFSVSLAHSDETLAPFKTVNDQFAMRLHATLDALAAKKFDLRRLSAVVGRGGM
ncbi:MAG: butyrate kinase, partial [Oscillospiraceae bacterium]